MTLKRVQKFQSLTVTQLFEMAELNNVLYLFDLDLFDPDLFDLDLIGLTLV